jgi:hypothetical protein
MTDYRVNHYCGELLEVGNESWDLRSNINWTEVVANQENNLTDDAELNGPRAEALRHDMNFYQVKSVKIIKPEKNDTAKVTAPKPQAKITDVKITKPVEKEKPRKEIYSQVKLPNENICEND